MHATSNILHPSTSVDLEEGETKEIRVWAFPESVKEYSRTVSLTVSTPGCVNPTPIEFPLTCYGVEPVRNDDTPSHTPSNAQSHTPFYTLSDTFFHTPSSSPLTYSSSRLPSDVDV